MKVKLFYGVACSVMLVAAAGQVKAQTQPRTRPSPVRKVSEAGRIERLEAALQKQAAELQVQSELLDRQRQQLDAQAAEISNLHDTQSRLQAAALPAAPNPQGPIATQAARPGLPAPVNSTANVSQAPNGGPTLVAPVPQTTPVGEAPPAENKVEIAALPEETSVLTPRGGWYVEPSFQYTRSSANVLVFRGVEIVTGVQVGLLEANNAARDTLVESIDVRYGLTNRLEVEGRIPYVSRADRVQTVAQRDESVTQNESLRANDIGDAELSLRYQFNSARPGDPIFIGGLRYKSDTGTSPYKLNYDQFGAATGLATGSGFHALEPSLSVLLPTDPAVIFGTLSYIHNFGRNIDRTIGGAHVGKVDPGDSVGASAGFGFALNPRFSFSLGYKHNYIFPTHTELNDTRQRSNVLQVGAFTFGWSYALTPRISIATSFEFGVTSDAPDLNLVFRVPIRF